MRVLFVYPDMSSTVTSYTGALSYSVGLLSAVLREAGHETSLYHLTKEPTEEEFRERVRTARPDLVAFSTISHYARRLGRWTTWAHEATGAPVAVGGVHATFAAEEVSALPGVHYTCIGEGEQPLLELCERLANGGDPTTVGNFWARRGGTLVRNPVRPILEDLDSLPDPDLSIFDVPRMYNSRLGTFHYVMSRGCAFRCTYCSAHTLRRVTPGTGGFWRFLSPERAARQLGALMRRHLPGAKLVSFGDAIFFPNRRWLADFVPLYLEHVGLPVSCNLRADFVDEETVPLLKQLGTTVVRLGVESGNERMTREVLRRHLGIEDLRRAYRLLREAGIERWSYNIVGLPGETLPMALETVRLNAELDPELALAFIFYPYPGTDLHRLCRDEGLLTDREYDHYKVGVTIRNPRFADGDVLFVHRWFGRLIRAHRAARRLPGWLARPAQAALDGVLASPVLPRGTIVGAGEAVRGFRHAVGERLVGRAPSLYRLLGGRAPSLRAPHAGREGVARAEA
jgi:anaerobic magnesium-protoporphyrin IX monomethyl ester cyclase